jgi:hypothetical protein
MMSLETPLCHSAMAVVIFPSAIFPNSSKVALCFSVIWLFGILPSQLFVYFHIFE